MSRMYHLWMTIFLIGLHRVSYAKQELDLAEEWHRFHPQREILRPLSCERHPFCNPATQFQDSDGLLGWRHLPHTGRKVFIFSQYTILFRIAALQNMNHSTLMF